MCTCTFGRCLAGTSGLGPCLYTNTVNSEWQSIVYKSKISSCFTQQYRQFSKLSDVALHV